MLSPKAEEIMLAQNRAGRGKKRAEEKESNNYELLYLLIEMRVEMKRIDMRNLRMS